MNISIVLSDRSKPISLELKPLTIFTGQDIFSTSIVYHRVCGSLHDSKIPNLELFDKHETWRGDNAELKNNPPNAFASRHLEILKLFEKLAGGVYRRDGCVQFRRSDQKTFFNLWLFPDVISRLSDTYFALKYNLRRSEKLVLLLKNPEMGLHPTKHLLFAHLIALLINLGIQVVLFTNSDFLIRELSILIGLKTGIKTKRKSILKYVNSAEGKKRVAYALDYKKVASYRIDKRSVVQETVDEFGIPCSTINEVIKQQHDDSEFVYWSE